MPFPDPDLEFTVSAMHAAGRSQQDGTSFFDGHSVVEHLRRPGWYLHHARLVGELTIEADGAGIATPRFDAEEGSASRLGPDAKLSEAVPGQDQRRPLVAHEAKRAADGMIEDHGIVVEQPFGQCQVAAANG